MDARWDEKHGKPRFGYKNPIRTERKHKRIRKTHVSDALVHDSQEMDRALDPGNPGLEVWADFHVIPDAGHAFNEPGIADRLVRTTDGYATLP